ncbi:MAG: hypothetical protein ACOH2E_06040 [Candidatus Paracaedibacter sp.]
MGTYLATGIVEKIIIPERDLVSRKYASKDKFSMENIVESLQKELDLDCYVFGEDKGSNFWEIKPEILEGNFIEFLETQFKMYNEKKNINELIEKIRDAQTGENIIKLAKNQNERLYDFQMMDYILDSIPVLHPNGFPDYISVNYHMITFFMDGKIIMECYGNILHYFEQVIRLQKEKYPVVKCVKVMIAG